MMRKPHAELAALSDAADWAQLWAEAIPEVDSSLRELLRQGALSPEDIDNDDLRQECYEAAGLAMRQWDPLLYAFTTHVMRSTRTRALDYRGDERGGGIGSIKQNVDIVSLQEPRDIPDEDEDGLDATLQGALTYAGIVLPSGQIDGQGYVPEGLGDPADEADRGRLQRAVQEAIGHLRDKDEREILRHVYGVGRFTLSVEEYAASEGIPLRSAERLLSRAKKNVAGKLANFRNTSYRPPGSEDQP